MAEKLEELNYKVQRHHNPSRKEMDKLFDDLKKNIKEAIKAK